MAGGGDTGFVYAATGATHVALALNSAASLRRASPNAQIDFWTDAEVPSGPFDAVYRLDRAHHRPKFEALRRSRFERTVYLDADTLILADISDIFVALERFDVAVAHVFRRNNFWGRQWRKPYPAALCELNGGVIGVRRSPAVDAFLKDVEEVVIARGGPDQPVFREMLLESELRLWVLPPEYNYKNLDQIATLTDADTAPRVLHMSQLHRRFEENGGRPPPLASIFQPKLLRHLQDLMASDSYLNPGQRTRVRPISARTLGRRVRSWLKGRQRRDMPFPEL